MLIGLSMTGCIADIVSGRVLSEKVAYIIAGTAFEDEEELQEHINMYQETYWRSFPDAAENLVLDMWATGRILQPRLNGGPTLEMAPARELGVDRWLICEQVATYVVTPEHGSAVSWL